MGRHLYRFDADSVGKVRRRLEAERAAAQPTDEGQAKSILEGMPSLLLVQTWRRHLPADWPLPGGRPRRDPSEYQLELDSETWNELDRRRKWQARSRSCQGRHRERQLLFPGLEIPTFPM